MNLSLPSWVTLNRLTWFVVMVFMALSVWLLWSYFTSDTSVLIQQPANQIKSADTNINQDNILRSPYFGSYLPEDSRHIQQTNLDLQLVGVLFSEDPNDSQVIIKAGSNLEKYYHLNDELPGGVIIKKITHDSVILLFNGRLEKLSLPKEKLIFEAKPKSVLIKE